VIHFNRQEAIKEWRAPDEALQASLKRMSRLQQRSNHLTHIRSWGMKASIRRSLREGYCTVTPEEKDRVA
jgi:hypothetical protein